MPTDLTQNSSDSRIPDIRLRPKTQKLLDNLAFSSTCRARGSVPGST